MSHTPVEVDTLARLQAASNWVDLGRHFIPAPERLAAWQEGRTLAGTTALVVGIPLTVGIKFGPGVSLTFVAGQPSPAALLWLLSPGPCQSNRQDRPVPEGRGGLFQHAERNGL